MVMKEDFDAASRHPDNQDLTKQSAIRQAREMLASAGVTGLGQKAEGRVLRTPEALIEIKSFSKETRKVLEKEGYVIYSLTGQSINSLRNAGRKFWSEWHKDFLDFEAIGSMQSEVAINTIKLFLPGSNNKTLVQQEEMVSKFSVELEKKVQGVKVIIGQAPDYVELAFKHLDETKKYLFGAKDNYNYARTKTLSIDSFVAYVGGFHDSRGFFFQPVGLGVGYWPADGGLGVIYAAPLVIPASPNRGESVWQYVRTS